MRRVMVTGAPARGRVPGPARSTNTGADGEGGRRWRRAGAPGDQGQERPLTPMRLTAGSGSRTGSRAARSLARWVRGRRRAATASPGRWRRRPGRGTGRPPCCRRGAGSASRTPAPSPCRRCAGRPAAGAGGLVVHQRQAGARLGQDGRPLVSRQEDVRVDALGGLLAQAEDARPPLSGTDPPSTGTSEPDEPDEPPAAAGVRSPLKPIPPPRSAGAAAVPPREDEPPEAPEEFRPGGQPGGRDSDEQGSAHPGGQRLRVRLELPNR